MVSARIGRALQQTVDDGAQVLQVRNRSQSERGPRRLRTACILLHAAAKIGPVNRNKNWIGVYRREEQMQPPIPLPLAKDCDCLPFERVAATDDDYLVRISLAVGSLSSDRSGAFRVPS
jgi:hypothetical protein